MPLGTFLLFSAAQIYFSPWISCIDAQTIRNADRIAVVEKGRISEIGTHDELMAIPTGQYKKLYNLQDLSSSGADAVETDETKKDRGTEFTNQSLVEDKKEKKDDKIETNKEREKELAKKAGLFGREDYPYFLIGFVGALLTGIMVGRS